VNGPLQRRRLSGRTIERSLFGSHCVSEIRIRYLSAHKAGVQATAATALGRRLILFIRSENLYLYTAITLDSLRITRLRNFLGSNDRKDIPRVLRQHHAAAQTNHHRQIKKKYIYIYTVVFLCGFDFENDICC
jgi:hypothetical protein